MKRAGTVSGVTLTLTLTLTAAAVGMTLGACQLVGDITDRSLESPGGDDGATLTDSRAPGVDGTVEKDGAPGSRPDANASSDAAIDGGNDATAPECLTNAQCTARASAEATEAGSVAATGDAAFNGILDGGVVPAVCVQSIGKCAPLLTPDCRALYGDYTNDNSILVGTIFNTTGSLAGANIPRQQAALLAAQEINSSVSGGGIPGVDGGPVRPLLVVECDPTANTIRTATHLAGDLHVAAVVGPNVAEDILNITQQVSASAGMLMMSPTVPIDPVTDLKDNGLTWRDIPSDSQRAPLYGDQIGALVTQLTGLGRSNLKLGVIVRNDALGSSALHAISSVAFGSNLTVGSPGANVTIDEYALSDTAAQAAIATKYAASVPDIIFVIAQEAVASIVIPLEQQLMTAGTPANKRPYYIATDTAKTTGWLSLPTGVASDFRSRVRGVGVTPDSASVTVFDAFNAAYKGAYSTNPGTAGMGPAYDAMYSVAYAIAAGGGAPVTGASVAQGLSQLDYGSSFPVGSNMAGAAFQTLATAGHISLQGTFTVMHWDSKGDMVGGTLQVWCVSAGTPAAFASSGRNRDLTSGMISGTYTACQ